MKPKLTDKVPDELAAHHFSTGSFIPLRWRWRVRPALISWLAMAGFAIDGPVLALAAESNFAGRAEKIFLAAQVDLRTNSASADAAWKLGRACFDWAEFAVRDDRRAEIAGQGIAACRLAVATAPKSSPAHYYLALNLGQLARTKSLGALKLVKAMEKELKAAIELDAKFDHAGAVRSLGLLYFEAPGWPASIGNRHKARTHLERAVEISPGYPDNRLSLAEAYLAWKDTSALEREIGRIKESWAKARKEFTGETWEQSWLDWEKRWETLRGKVTPGGGEIYFPTK